MKTLFFLSNCFLLSFCACQSHQQELSKLDSEKYILEQITKRDKMYSTQYQNEWKSRELTNKEYRMKFTYKIFGEKPHDGRSLYISMHGGGHTKPEVNDKQWNNQKSLYNPTEGMYFVPRSPTDTWNMWHQEYMDSLIRKVINLAIIHEDVNPNKVYIMGYSAGGDGTYQLAPRLADHWAGAAMSAGHPGDAHIENLCNLPFALYMGGQDSAFNRNGLAFEWKEKLAQLHAKDKKYYLNDVQIFDSCGHWMQRKDTVGLAFMAKHTRNPIPSKVIWNQDDVIRENFYWLEMDRQEAQKGDRVIASYCRETNLISIDEVNCNLFTICINDEMLDLEKPIKVVVDGKVLFEGIALRNKHNIDKDINSFRDQYQIFPARIKVNIEEQTSTIL